MKLFKNILIFADGSQEMTATLQRAAQLAESNHACLALVEVIEPVDKSDQILSGFKTKFNPSEIMKYQNVLVTVDTDSLPIKGCDELNLQLATPTTERENAHLNIVHALHLPVESMFRATRFRMPVQELEAMLLNIFVAIAVTLGSLQVQRLKLMVARSNGYSYSIIEY